MISLCFQCQWKRLESRRCQSCVFDFCKIDRKATDNINSLLSAAVVPAGRLQYIYGFETCKQLLLSKFGRFGHSNGLYTLVEESPMVTTVLHNQTCGLDNGGIDSPLMEEINNYKEWRTSILQEHDRRSHERLVW